jgi:hypothetical protein
VRSWRGLVDGLEETASLVQDEDVQTSKVVFKFLGLQGVFWACTIYIQTYWVMKKSNIFLSLNFRLAVNMLQLI